MTEDQMNPDICSGALEEDGTLDRSKWDGAHKWDEETNLCDECGSEREKPDLNAVKSRAKDWLEDEQRFSDKCEKENYTDVEMAWMYIGDARAIISDLLRSI